MNMSTASMKTVFSLENQLFSLEDNGGITPHISSNCGIILWELF